MTNIERALLSSLYPKYKWLETDIHGTVRVFTMKPSYDKRYGWTLERGKGDSLEVTQNQYPICQQYPFSDLEHKQIYKIKDLLEANK